VVKNSYIFQWAASKIKASGFAKELAEAGYKDYEIRDWAQFQTLTTQKRFRLTNCLSIIMKMKGAHLAEEY